jgi:hypothetical protein
MGSINLNDFVSISGVNPSTLSLSFIVTQNIIKGKTYVFRYRAVNYVGPGPWSSTTQIIAASVPAAPPKPTYLFSTDTSI